MMKLLLIPVLVAISGCASHTFVQSTSLTAAAMGGADSAAASPIVLRLLTPAFSTRTAEVPSFEVGFANRTGAPVMFSPANVTARSGAATVRVYAGPELADRVRREAAFDRYNVRTRSELQAQAAEYDPHAVGSVPTILIRTTALQDEAAVNWAERRQIEQARQMLAVESVPPGGRISGVIKLHAEDIQPGVPLVLTVSVAGERREFTFDVGR